MIKNPVCAVLLCLLAVMSLSADEGAKQPDWRIELVPGRNSEGKGAVLYAKKPLDVFYVVLHNQSGRDLKVWRDWCPWGYDNLSFVVDPGDGGGREMKITRKPNNWGKSYPDAALVKAGACYVYPVHLAGKTWKGTDAIPDAKPVKLAVVFRVPATPESKQKNVWVGEVVSKPVQVTLRK